MKNKIKRILKVARRKFISFATGKFITIMQLKRAHTLTHSHGMVAVSWIVFASGDRYGDTHTHTKLNCNGFELKATKRKNDINVMVQLI